MITRLTGRLLEKLPTSVIIDINGIGFEVLISRLKAKRKGREYEVQNDDGGADGANGCRKRCEGTEH